MTKTALTVALARTLTAGTKLILLAHEGQMNALPGATAIVGPKGYHSQYGASYLDVIWTDPIKAWSQNNGGYYPESFALAEPAAGHEPVKTKPLTPQARDVLKMLQASGRITGVQAANVLKVRSLSRRIVDLKEAGHKIERKMKVDHTGQRYAEYSLAA
ncbi:MULTISPECIES: helix-turn-helix domain-containing protein [unclassified Mesorhizobium]|uniref:helix-turn-helix domain-containing protein n=1 Tax=unclassified Mesorhizobium TaxID=325217 RepID=UPI000FCA6562|nr:MULTISPECIES: helix-turn-helix domain-containing protein [unclassified Mesorhizobium]RUX95939.1 hypothetical protein EN993_09640 [Mesorhizobium sp. M7D.F.Ca.US.004.01.2.1]RVA32775.1 hypothetical protein EN935_10935 [Mesorhizobium sp. M7D.F.Ca.US.004.03.1.1]